jgi:5'-nucleotidase
MRGRRLVALAVAGLVLASGCRFYPQAVRGQTIGTANPPWWCTADGVTLNRADCDNLSLQLDFTEGFAESHWHGSDSLAEGAVAQPYAAGIGARFVRSAPTTVFSAALPDVALYDGTGPDAQLVGVEWNIVSATEPAGFSGTLDEWSGPVGGVWTLRAWIVRPFEHQVDVFATSHPCLADGGAVYDLAASCYSSTHPEPMQILVTNDDGYGAPGIDAIVEGLRTVPGVEVTVVAPATNQSGSGENTTPGGVTSFEGTTASGYPAVAVNGFPADSVIHALNVLGENPDLVVSGSNAGQNIGPLVNISGTVGAARRAVRMGVPAVAISQGFGSPPDYPSSVDAILDWLEDYRLGRAGAPFQEVANINVPTCTAGSIRGTVEVPTATDFAGRPFNPSNCLSTVTTLNDDVDAFIHGFVALADAGL